MFRSLKRNSGLLVAVAMVANVYIADRCHAEIISATVTTIGPVSPGQVVNFDINLSGVSLATATDNIDSITLDFTASDASLTLGGIDFSAFSFVADPGLTGLLSDSTDTVGLTGVEFLSSNAFFGGADTGILNSTGDIRLGTLSVVAPAISGTYTVNFFVDDFLPFLGTHLAINDGGFFPIEEAPIVVGDSFTVTTVVPEPSSAVVFACGAGLLFIRRRLGAKSRHTM